MYERIYKTVTFAQFLQRVKDLKFTENIQFACSKKDSYERHYGVTRRKIFDADLIILSCFGVGPAKVINRESSTLADELYALLRSIGDMDDTMGLVVHIDTKEVIIPEHKKIIEVMEFDLDKFKLNPETPLFVEHSQDSEEIWPVLEAQLVIGDRVAVKMPVNTGYSIPEIQLADGDEIRDDDNNLVGYLRFKMCATYPLKLKILAESIYSMEVGEEINFKLSPDSDLWGITLLEKFECEVFYLCYFGGHYTEVINSADLENPSDLCSWMSAILEINGENNVYPLSERELYPERYLSK